ncbi:hypothetical protein BJ973_001849 [Actinoplanes tereljensis]|uniref:Uncharacterized protein n=1 Tax=Paractinoplanes tereljensis TaxID=571912 RepID=A0A919NK78_9ACTN|nr:hypothetical protein [Actinoplanes tereljensis]GIF20245.1 hypothetical protein Ate02nite_29750 [Actinoplanes tereljensis]
MEWVSANKDILSLLIALLAILVSLSTVLISRRNARTTSFIAIQNVMLSGDLQRGRLLVYRAIQTGDVPPHDSDEEYLMVRSLAIFDLLGMLSGQGIVPRRWVLRYWHARLQLLRHGFGMEEDPSRPYIVHGRPDLQDLIERAERYRCDRTCCANGQRERRLECRNEISPRPRTRFKSDLAADPGRGVTAPAGAALRGGYHAAELHDEFAG